MPTANNKVTVHTNVAELTVGKSGDDYSTLTGTKNKLVDGSELATKVSSFVNTRLGEEISKLNFTDDAATD